MMREREIVSCCLFCCILIELLSVLFYSVDKQRRSEGRVSGVTVTVRLCLCP